MRHLALAMAAVLLCGPAKADGEAPGDFDYYVMSLSWAPNWCALTGDSRGDAECDKHGLTFTLHGLWPQYEDGGFPARCATNIRPPSRGETAAMEDVMGSDGLAWHEWKTHGTCSGLPARDYLDLMRKAYRSVTLPPLFAKVGRRLDVAPAAIEDAFLESNPGLSAEDLAVTCSDGMIQEVRICLTKDLAPRPCGADLRACRLPAAELEPVR